MVALYPLTFEPRFKAYTWGGRKLARVVGRDTPPGKIAESWEVSGHPNGTTPVRSGALAGRPLSELVGELGESLVGTRNRDALARDRFPVLIKLLDANEWLSIQVHPRDVYAREHEGESGKTEMWVVLQADEGAEIIFGLDRTTDVGELRRSIGEQRLPSLLHRVPARAGDVFFVPAGTVHALGPGLLLVEIQQTSDTTYRLYDWGRRQDDREPRPLHLDRGLEVLDLGAIRPGPVRAESERRDRVAVEVLASCPYFETHRLTLAAGAAHAGSCDGATYELWCALEGEAEIEWSGDSVTADRLEWVLLPATLGEFRVRARRDATLLRVFTPETA